MLEYMLHVYKKYKKNKNIFHHKSTVITPNI